MKILIVFPIAAMLLAAADAPPANPPAEAAPVPVAVPAGIPAGAVQIGPNSYRVTLPDGKTRLYHNSPFGIMSANETPAPRSIEDKSMALVSAKANGDLIRFEWKTPLGPFHWDKKESELSDMEQAVWQRDKPRNGSAQD